MKYREEIIEFTKQLVRIPSYESESVIAKEVFRKLVSFGFKPKIIGPGEHPSVICFIHKDNRINSVNLKIGKNSKKTIWLESPLDTGPTGDLANWRYPPFEAKVFGNKMFGRGVADAKVAIALFCYLAKDLSRDKNFNGPIFLGFDAEEQSGKFSGIKEIIKRAPKADVCILGYQGIEEISIGARGWLRIKLTTFGKSIHTGSRFKKGINAISNISRAIEALSQINLQAKKEPFFEFGSSLNVTRINGGVAINIVPDKCEADIDIRLTPSQNEERVLSLIKKSLEELKKEDPTFNYSLEVFQSESAFLTNPKIRFVQILRDKTRKILDKDIPLTASGGGSVGNIISKLGIPVINCFGCEIDNVHAPNEWVNLETLPKVYTIYKQALLEYDQNQPYD